MLLILLLVNLAVFTQEDGGGLCHTQNFTRLHRPVKATEHAILGFSLTGRHSH
jgi:hypothetical protein